MKVTLFFCLLAVYGAVADDDDTTANVAVNVDVDVTATDDSDSDSSELAFMMPGNMISTGLNVLDSGLEKKEALVNSSLEIAKLGMNGGMTAAQQAMTGAQQIVTAGTEMGVDLTNTMTNTAKQITGKAMDMANIVTLGKLGNIMGMVNSTAQGGIELGKIAATTGINAGASLGNWGLKLGKSITKTVNEKTETVLDKMGTMESVANQKGSALAHNMANKISGAGVALGNKFSKSWTLKTQ